MRECTAPVYLNKVYGALFLIKLRLVAKRRNNLSGTSTRFLYSMSLLLLAFLFLTLRENML